MISFSFRDTDEAVLFSVSRRDRRYIDWALRAACSPEVIVLTFILMSSHVHFVVVGTREEVEVFFHQFKRRYGVYFNARRALLPASAAWTICLPGRGNGCFIRTAARFLWIGI